MNFDRKGFYEQVGILLQLKRKRQKLTQEDVARKLSMPRASYANIERGRRQAPVDVIWRLSILFKVPLATLVPEQKTETRAAPLISSMVFPTLSNVLPALEPAGHGE